MGALDLIAKAAKAGKKSAPFFSKADVLLDELQRGKGTGQEFLTELVKKGAKPTELRERGIEKALKEAPKMTKAEVQKLFEEKAPPRIREEIRGGNEYQEALDQKAREIIGDEYATFDDLYGRDADMAEAAVESDFGYNPRTQHEEWKTPGGENYREILLKLPKRGLNEAEQRNLMNYEASIRRGDKLDKWHQSQYDALKAKEAMGNQDFYHRQHWGDTPNVLAHIRVQDFQSPTKGYAVVNTRSGNKSPVFQTVEEAQAYMAQMPESLQGMLRIDEAAGKPKKVLLVDEIQSDWHQAGRKQGYREGAEPLDPAKAQRVKDKIFERFDAGEIDREQRNALLDELSRAMEVGRRVPDAPFKKNWHELAMKRVLDYAAENGYDTVAITPGAEQAKRYDLSKQVQQIMAAKEDGGVRIFARDNQGKNHDMGVHSPEALDAVIGKDLAEKVAAQTKPTDIYQGVDLQVGGEGMKGFYDKILPDYLNTYGKQYGASVGQMDLPLGYTDESKRLINDAYARGTRADIDAANAQAQMRTLPVHRFDITPQMREVIKTKGQPLYSTMGAEGLAAGSGAATIGADALMGNDEQPVQNPVHFTENPDAMLLELMQRN